MGMSFILLRDISGLSGSLAQIQRGAIPTSTLFAAFCLDAIGSWSITGDLPASRPSYNNLARILGRQLAHGPASGGRHFAKLCSKESSMPNIAFKPKLHRYAVNMAERACHVASYALQFGLT